MFAAEKMMVVTGVHVSRKGWMVVVNDEDDVGGSNETQNRTRNSLRLIIIIFLATRHNPSLLLNP
ncbi:hypothetical protein Hanom_Chr04g00299911 [Helianthus anomalus]